MFINASEFFLNFSLFRQCWIGGRVGGYKTLLAVAMAGRLLETALVDGVVSNFPTVYPVSLLEDDLTIINKAVIFDEAWEELDSRQSITNPREYGAYARKFGTYWIYPSVNQIDKRLRLISVFMVDEYPAFHVVVYKWQLNVDYAKIGGWFALWRPERFFGRYDTAWVPYSDGGISARWQQSMAKQTRGKRFELPKSLDYQAALAALGGGEGVTDVA